MSYELGITEVGPVEYPLIEVLRETIFAEFGHRSLSTIAEDLKDQQDVLALVAHLEGNPIGFKVGHRDHKGVYYSKCGGVLREYRHLGLARRMQEWQHRFARERGYTEIWYNTFNHFRDMIVFGLQSGFVPVGAKCREMGGMSFEFRMKLNEPVYPLPQEEARIPREPDIEIEHRRRGDLIVAVKAGYCLNGIRHDFSAGDTFILLRKDGG